jgi:hypothetical protein
MRKEMTPCVLPIISNGKKGFESYFARNLKTPDSDIQ